MAAYAAVNSNNIAKHLMPYVGSYRAQALISEKLVDMHVSRVEDIQDIHMFLDSLFSSIFRNSFSFSSLHKKKNEFIEHVLSNEHGEQEIASFETLQPCKQVLHTYFSDVFDPRVGPQLLNLKIEQLGMSDIDNYSKHHVPLIVHLIMRHAFSEYDDAEKLAERTKKIFIMLYGEDMGPKICETVLSLRTVYIDFLSLLFNKSIAELLLTTELSRNKKEDIFMLLLSEQMRLVGRSVRTLLSGSMDADEIDNINMIFLHFLREEGNIDALPQGTKEILMKAGGYSELYRLHMKRLFEQEAKPESLVKAVEAFYEHTIEDDHRTHIIEFLGRMQEENSEDYFYTYTLESEEGVWEARIADFFDSALNRSSGRLIVQNVKRELGLGSLDKADRDDRKRFVDYALKSYFDKDMSLQKTKLFENALRTLLNAHT